MDTATMCSERTKQKTLGGAGTLSTIQHHRNAWSANPLAGIMQAGSSKNRGPAPQAHIAQLAKRILGKDEVRPCLVIQESPNHCQQSIRHLAWHGRKVNGLAVGIGIRPAHLDLHTPYFLPSTPATSGSERITARVSIMNPLNTKSPGACDSRAFRSLLCLTARLCRANTSMARNFVRPAGQAAGQMGHSPCPSPPCPDSRNRRPDPPPG